MYIISVLYYIKFLLIINVILSEQPLVNASTPLFALNDTTMIVGTAMLHVFLILWTNPLHEFVEAT